ncbi:hypothetical protein CIK05_11795 [Bdellovibrio sp. qaytius]|nr:hypothetical protein CIK05_11795 [Bdellovibrio sp. qaytius]
MNRKNAIFDSSRLYQQAQNGSQRLLKLTEADCYNQIHIKKIFGISDVDDVHLISASATQEKYQRCLMIFKNLTAQMDPHIALPILLQTVDEYYSSGDLNPSWLGTSIKSAMAHIWPNAISDSTLHNNRSIELLIEIIQLAAICEQLYIINMLQQSFGDGPLYFTLHSLDPENKLDRSVISFVNSKKLRGKSFRTLKDATSLITTNKNAYDNVAYIVSGGDPSQIPEFKDTILSEISLKKAEYFWINLHLRLHLLQIAHYTRSHVSENPLGICILSDVVTKLNSTNVKLNQKALESIFWNTSWYQSRISFWATNMIVERPILRISKRPSLFVCSYFSMLESINWFIESSIMKYTETGGASVPSSAFEKYISKPYENNVINDLRARGFLAGEVTENGVWINQKNEINIQSMTNISCPGQIDVLAHHPQLDISFIIDCKVLRSPLHLQSLRNVISKISSDDTEGFASKIKNKASWVESSSYLVKVEPIILLDKEVPGEMTSEVITINSEIFQEFLNSKLKEN